MTTRTIRRVKGNEFCNLEITLREKEQGLELSLVGVHGHILTDKEARRKSLQFWIDFFEGSPEEMYDMNRRFNKRFRSTTSAAKFVLEMDGEYHGLDIVSEEGNLVYICESCGQIRDTIAEFFPEAVPYFKWHLNGMNAGCEHQDDWNNDRIGEPCPVCGYKYGTKWLYRELPADVIEWAKTFGL